MITRLRPFTEEVENLEQVLEEIRALPVYETLSASQQSYVWAKFMAWLLGKEHVELWLEHDEERLVAASWIYIYPLRWGRYWLYAARGPIAPHTDSNLLKAVIEAHPKAVWLRWDPLWSDEQGRQLLLGATPAHASFHPKSTLVVDISLDEPALLEQMKPKGRYNIRLATKKGVKVSGWMYDETGNWKQILRDSKELTEAEAIKTYTQLSRTTTARDGFSGHGEEYFSAFLREMPSKSFLLLAEAEGEWIAGGIFTLHEDLCTYYYGASSNSQREKMAPYAMQWTAMLYAKSLGCRTYDFLGVATPDSTDPSDLALTGVTDFKTKFGGRILTRGKSWEKILNRRWFLLIRFIKSLRPIMSRARRP